jgi:hypothetical protein
MGGAGSIQCLRCAVRHPSLVGRATRVALVVGTVLTAINQGNLIIGGHLSAELLWKIPLTFLVPYSVSTYSTLGAVRQKNAPANSTSRRSAPATPAPANTEGEAYGSD